MTALRCHIRRWALLLVLGFALGAAQAPASACAAALDALLQGTSTSCTGCGDLDDPGQAGWSCAAPCVGGFALAPGQASIFVAREASDAVHAAYRYVDWSAPPLIPPPRST